MNLDLNDKAQVLEYNKMDDLKDWDNTYIHTMVNLQK